MVLPVPTESHTQLYLQGKVYLRSTKCQAEGLGQHARSVLGNGKGEFKHQIEQELGNVRGEGRCLGKEGVEGIQGISGQAHPWGHSPVLLSSAA